MINPRPRQASVPAFHGFLEYLREQGFEVGVAHYVRVEQLLGGVNLEEYPPERLETLLRPIFATSRERQEQFSKAFKNYADLVSFQLETIEGTGTTPKAAQQARRKRLALVGAGLFAAAAILAVVWYVTTPQPQSADTNSNSAGQAAPGGGSPQANANTGGGVVNPPGGKGEDDVRGPEAQNSASDIFLSTLLLLLCTWLAYEAYRSARRYMILRRQRGKSPPYTWRLAVTRPVPDPYDTEEFRRVARLLRRRQVSDFRRLDLKATVNATVRALGFPVIREAAVSKPPEYLILVERVSDRDHQAQLFGELWRALKRENIFVAAYYYNVDPRVCTDESGRNTVHLGELLSNYAGHRLLIFGDGAALLDPATGEFHEWTKALLNWRDRALLTPAPAEGLREAKLRERLAVMPATSHGLRELALGFGAVETPAWDWEGRRAGSPLPLREEDFHAANSARLVEQLRWYCGDAFRWLCACAVYPALQWELTLHLGTLKFLKDGAVNEENLLRLVSLPWFRRGSIPDEIRWPLIRALTRPEEQAVREALLHFLSRPESRPPADTFAADAHLVQLFTQQWLLNPTREGFKDLTALLRRMPLSQLYRDGALVNFLKLSPTSQLAERLSPRLRAAFYRRGLPGFGPSRGLLFALALLLSAVLLPALLPLLRNTPLPLLAANAPEPDVSPSVTLPPTPSATPQPTTSFTPPPTTFGTPTPGTGTTVPTGTTNSTTLTATPSPSATRPRTVTPTPTETVIPTPSPTSTVAVTPGPPASVTPTPGEGGGVGPGRIKFDQYTSIPLGDKKARLDNYSNSLQENIGAQAYILCYGGRRGRAGEAQTNCDFARDYLVNTRGIDAGRIVTIDAGYQEKVTEELWIVPVGGSPPPAEPTVDPSEVQTTPTPRRRRRGGR